MKKYIFAALLFPLFATAQDSLQINEAQDGIMTPAAVEQAVSDQNTEIDHTTGRWKTVRCGRHSDSECLNHRVYESCDKDNSHGYYGQCRNIAQRGPEVVCSCR